MDASGQQTQSVNWVDEDWPCPPSATGSTPVVRYQHSPDDQPLSSAGPSDRPAEQSTTTYKPQSPMADTGRASESTAEPAASSKKWSNCAIPCCAPSSGSGTTSPT